jgi:hypothetical protein
MIGAVVMVAKITPGKSYERILRRAERAIHSHAEARYAWPVHEASAA